MSKKSLGQRPKPSAGARSKPAQRSLPSSLVFIWALCIVQCAACNMHCAVSNVHYAVCSVYYVSKGCQFWTLYWFWTYCNAPPPLHPNVMNCHIWLDPLSLVNYQLFSINNKYFIKQTYIPLEDLNQNVGKYEKKTHTNRRHDLTCFDRVMVSGALQKPLNRTSRPHRAVRQAIRYYMTRWEKSGIGEKKWETSHFHRTQPHPTV